MKPNKIPGEDRKPFLLHQYQRLDEYRLKKNDNVYLVHYPGMDGSFVRRENAYIVQFLNGEYILYVGTYVHGESVTVYVQYI